MRWSATQEITGPSIAAEPRIAEQAVQPGLRLEAAVGEEAVEADRDPEPGEEVHAEEEEDVAPVQRLAPDLPGGEAERKERDQRHQPGDDPVARLVGDRLNIGWERSRAFHQSRDHTAARYRKLRRSDR